MTNIDPIRFLGRLARRRITAKSICLPFGRSQSNGTETVAHCNWSSRGLPLHFFHLIPDPSDPVRAGDAAAYGVLTDTATRPNTIAATAVRTRRRGLLVGDAPGHRDPRPLEDRNLDHQPTPSRKTALAQPLLIPIQALW